MLPNSYKILCFCVKTDENYKFISCAIVCSSVISFQPCFNSTEPFVPFRFDFM